MGVAAGSAAALVPLGQSPGAPVRLTLTELALCTRWKVSEELSVMWTHRGLEGALGAGPPRKTAIRLLVTGLLLTEGGTAQELKSCSW
jgi:hypothetical protein